MLKLSSAGMELSCKANADVGDWGKQENRFESKRCVCVCVCVKRGESQGKRKKQNKRKDGEGGAGKSRHGNKKWQIL